MTLAAATCLTVPGLDGSGPGHWQTIWERERGDCARIELGCWDDPLRNPWIQRIDRAVAAAPGPIVLAAHSLGCQAVLWWTYLLGDQPPEKLIGALLVAPPDVERVGVDRRLARFAPTPRARLRVPAIIVASTDDPYADPGTAEALAGDTGAAFLLIEGEGHINARSGLGAWSEGQALLDGLLENVPPSGPKLPPRAPPRSRAGRAALG